jgi:hypothetical protein
MRAFAPIAMLLAVSSFRAAETEITVIVPPGVTVRVVVTNSTPVIPPSPTNHCDTPITLMSAGSISEGSGITIERNVRFRKR